MTGYLKAITTTATKSDAENLAGELLKERLAACVQITGPINSWYRWKGNIECSEEFLLFIKTSESVFSELEKRIRELHPYETPEIIAVPIINGSEAYLGWLNAEIRAV